MLLGRMHHAVAVGLDWAKVRATGEVIGDPSRIKNDAVSLLYKCDIILYQIGSRPLLFGHYSTGVSPLGFWIVAPKPASPEQRCHYAGEIEVDLS